METVQPTCARCESVIYKNVRWAGGQDRPYARGLVRCSIRGSGFYPNQRHSCPDFSEDIEARDLETVVREMERDWNQENSHGSF